MKIAIVVGTRPEIIKLAPVIKECIKRKIKTVVIHTGQHYSYELDKLIFSDLMLPKAKYNLEVGSGSHSFQTAEIMKRTEDVLIKEKPNVVLVQGDTNSGLAAAMAAAKLHIPLGHVEAGLRSYDRRMPEEINRVVIDHISDFLFVPVAGSKRNALAEGIPAKKIIVTGNTIVDAVLANKKIAGQKSKILKKLKLEPHSFFLLTLHRPENVDDSDRLAEIIKSISYASSKYSQTFLWPMHPRTLTILTSSHLLDKLTALSNVKIITPVGFLDFILLEAMAKLVLTDSGGVQEETCIVKTPCITLRDNTERPESIDVGANMLVRPSPVKLVRAMAIMLDKKRNWKDPFGDGKSAKRIVDYLTGAKI